MTDLLVTAGVAPREKFTTIYSGMEIESFLEAEPLRDETRRCLGYNEEQIVVGKLARLFHLKGHDDFLSAAEQCAAANPQLRFLLVGDGVLREQIEVRIASSILRDRVQITGLVPPNEIPALLSSMDIVAHCSLREGLARVLPQALLAGRPAISYDIDGAREVVVDNKTGLLLPPRDVDGLATAILRLADDAGLRERLAVAGRSKCSQMFRHETMTEQVREVYQTASRTS